PIRRRSFRRLVLEDQYDNFAGPKREVYGAVAVDGSSRCLCTNNHRKWMQYERELTQQVF
ncbi:hypothetical protein, partial [Burkholderia cenocepacia]|uniref:hypothetical protein n=1 Tax=Burkholderia cenocepacia TaxID=95486 RepID=UPI001955CE82